MRLLGTLLFALVLSTGVPAFAEDKDPGPAGKAVEDKAVEDKAGEGKEGEGKEEAKKPATPLARLIDELKSLVAREKSKPEYDKSLVKNLEALIAIYQRNVEEVRLEDLSEADRKRLENEVREKMQKEREAAADGGGPGGGGNRWADRLTQRAYEDVKITDEERKKTDPILAEYAQETAAAYQQNDFKLIGDLKKDLERQLKKAVGNKRARDIMNNVNRASGRGWGGR